MDMIKLRGAAAMLLYKHKLVGWRFEINSRMGRCLGKCLYGQKLIRIAEHYARANSEEEVMDTLLHEIAHALEPGHGHDSVWKACAMRLGCAPLACSKERIEIRPGQYRAVCPSCGRVHNKYRRPKFKCHNEQITPYYCTATSKCGPERGKLVFLLYAEGEKIIRDSSV